MTIHQQPQHLVAASSPHITLGLDDPRLPRKAVKVDCRWLGIEWSASVACSGNVDAMRREALRRAPPEIGRKAACHPEHLRATVTVKVSDLFVPPAPVPAPATAPAPPSLPPPLPPLDGPYIVSNPGYVDRTLLEQRVKAGQISEQLAFPKPEIAVTPYAFLSPSRGRSNRLKTISPGAYSEMMLGTPVRADDTWHQQRDEKIRKDELFSAYAKAGLDEIIADFEDLLAEAFLPHSDLPIDDIYAELCRFRRLRKSLDATHATYLYGICDGNFRRLVSFNQQIMIAKMRARCRADAVALEEFLVETEATGSMITISPGWFPVEKLAKIRRLLTKVFQRAKKNLRKQKGFGKLGVSLDWVYAAHETTVRKTSQMQAVHGMPVCGNGESTVDLYVHPHMHMIVLHKYIDPAVYLVVKDLVAKAFRTVARNNGISIKTVNWTWMRRAGRDGAKKVVSELVKYSMKGTALHLVDNDLTPIQCAYLYRETHGARMRIHCGSLYRWRKDLGLTPDQEILGRYIHPDDPDYVGPMVIRRPAAKIRRCGEERVIVQPGERRADLVSRWLEWVDASPLRPGRFVIRSNPRVDPDDFTGLPDVDVEEEDLDDGDDFPTGERSSVVGVSGLTAMPGERMQRHLVMRGRDLSEEDALRHAEAYLERIATRVNQDRHIYNSRVDSKDRVPYIESWESPGEVCSTSSKGWIAGPGIYFQRDHEIAIEEVMEDVRTGGQSSGILQTQVVTLPPATHPPRPRKPPRSGKRGPPTGAKAPP